MIKVIQDEDGFHVWIGMEDESLIDPAASTETFMIGSASIHGGALNQAAAYLETDLAEVRRLQSQLATKCR